MKSIKVRSACLIVLIPALLAGCASDSSSNRGEVRETAGNYLDDSVITTKVKSAVFNEPGLDSAEIGVETYKGVVQLSGFVDTQEDIDRAVRVARGVEGVRSVKNDLRLKLHGR